MLILPAVSFALLASCVFVESAPTVSPLPINPTEDDPLDTSETGHFRRKNLWKKLLKQLIGFGVGGVGFDLRGGTAGKGLRHHHYPARANYVNHGVGYDSLGGIPGLYPGKGYGYHHYPGGGYAANYAGEYLGYAGHLGYTPHYGVVHGLYDGGTTSWDLLDGYGWGGLDALNIDGGFLQ